MFEWFQSIVAIAYLCAWSAICLAYICYYKVLGVQGVKREELRFRATGGHYSAWFGLIAFCVILLFNGFAVFMHENWNTKDFVSAYIGIP